MSRFRHPDWTLLLATLILISIGLVMVPSSSGRVEYFHRELVRIAPSLVLMMVVLWLPISWLRKTTSILLLSSLGLLVLVLILGRKVNGAKLAILGFQPAEVLRFGLVLYLADFLERKAWWTRRLSRGFLPVLLILAVSFVLMALEPNWGIAITVSLLACAILLVGGVPWKRLLVVGLLGGIVVGAILWSVPYTRARLATWYQGWTDPSRHNDSVRESLIAIGSGGIWGKGIGSSRQRFHLPEAHSDFIYAIVAEECGLGGALLVLGLYAVFGWRGLLIAQRAPNRYSLLLAFGLTSSVLLYAFLNVSIALGILPTTGLPLPFISYGGSSLLFNSVSVGILLNLSRECTDSGKPWAGFRDENIDRRWRNRWASDARGRDS